MYLKKKHDILLYKDKASDPVSNITDGREWPIVSGLIQRVNVKAFWYYLLRWIVNRQATFTEIKDEVGFEMGWAGLGFALHATQPSL
jgi:hypothetical protein